MKIQFVQHHVVRGQTRDEDVIYEKDQVADFGKDPVANTYALAYIERGYAVAVDDAADRRPSREGGKADAQAAKLDARGKIVIPDDLSKLKDQEMIDLGTSVSDVFVKNKDDALKAVAAEKTRRNPT